MPPSYSLIFQYSILHAFSVFYSMVHSYKKMAVPMYIAIRCPRKFKQVRISKLGKDRQRRSLVNSN